MPQPTPPRHEQAPLNAPLTPHTQPPLVKTQGWLHALEVAGQRLITTHGKRWVLGATVATPTLGCALTLLLHTQAKHEVALSKLFIGGLSAAACGVLLGSCLLAWPKLLYDARVLVHSPMTAPQEPPWRAFSLFKTLKRTFGPILFLITPASSLLALGCAWFAAAWDGLSLSTLLLSTVLFGLFAFLGWGSLSFLGVAVAGKHALDQHRTLKQHRALSDSAEVSGALALSVEHGDEVGALSLSQESGALTQLSATSSAPEMGDGELIVYTPSASHETQ